MPTPQAPPIEYEHGDGHVYRAESLAEVPRVCKKIGEAVARGEMTLGDVNLLVELQTRGRAIAAEKQNEQDSNTVVKSPIEKSKDSKEAVESRPKQIDKQITENIAATQTEVSVTQVQHETPTLLKTESEYTILPKDVPEVTINVVETIERPEPKQFAEEVTLQTAIIEAQSVETPVQTPDIENLIPLHVETPTHNEVPRILLLHDKVEAEIQLESHAPESSIGEVFDDNPASVVENTQTVFVPMPAVEVFELEDFVDQTHETSIDELNPETHYENVFEDVLEQTFTEQVVIDPEIDESLEPIVEQVSIITSNMGLEEYADIPVAAEEVSEAVDALLLALDVERRDIASDDEEVGFAELPKSQVILEKIVALPAELQGDVTEEFIKEELTTLFIELFEETDIDYSPELVEVFVLITMRNSFDTLIEEHEYGAAKSVTMTPRQIGTREFLQKLQRQYQLLLRHMPHRHSKLGSSAIHMSGFKKQALFAV